LNRNHSSQREQAQLPTCTTASAIPLLAHVVIGLRGDACDLLFIIHNPIDICPIRRTSPPKKTFLPMNKRRVVVSN